MSPVTGTLAPTNKSNGVFMSEEVVMFTILKARIIEAIFISAGLMDESVWTTLGIIAAVWVMICVVTLIIIDGRASCE